MVDGTKINDIYYDVMLENKIDKVKENDTQQDEEIQELTEDDRIKNLTYDEIQKLEVGSIKNKVRALKEENLDIIINLNVQKKLVKQLESMVLSRDVELLQRDKKDLMSKNIEKRNKHKAWVDKLKERYDIQSEKWGYDPLTGIISDE